MSVDERAMAIADAAVAGTAPTREDVIYLLQFDGYSVEAAYVEARAREIAMESAQGVATIHAQIGVDANSCPMNCQYCSFAQVNEGICTDDAELPLDTIVTYAKMFDERGVHLISLMSTAGLSPSRYLEIVSAVRDAISDDMPILANTGDMDIEYARKLKDAGATAAYHAVRMGEGTYTAIDPERRRRTIANIREANLALMTGVEPLWEGCDIEEVADRLCEIPGFDPYCTGACGLTSTKGTVLAHKGMQAPKTGLVRYVGALSRLVCGYDVRFGGVGGAIWVDAGTDPRNRGYGSSAESIEHDIRRARRTLEKDGWNVPARPDMSWFE